MLTGTGCDISRTGSDGQWSPAVDVKNVMCEVRACLGECKYTGWPKNTTELSILNSSAKEASEYFQSVLNILRVTLFVTSSVTVPEAAQA